VNKGQARRTILELAGKLKTVQDSVDALAEAILADRGRPIEGGEKP